MLERLKHYMPVFLLTICAWAIVFIVCFTVPVSFSAYLETDSLAPFMYWVSESGGVYGTMALLLVIATVFAWTTSPTFKKVTSFLAILAGLGGLLGGLAALNEHVIKPAVHSPRPSHLYLQEKGVVTLNELYKLDDEERTEIMQERIKEAPGKVDHVYGPILIHWTFESGFSFPSGHSQNAFLLSTVVAFLVYSRTGRNYRWLMAIPLIWAVSVCISRMAIGIHTSYDVIAGASAGMIIGFAIALTGVLDQKKNTNPNNS